MKNSCDKDAFDDYCLKAFPKDLKPVIIYLQEFPTNNNGKIDTLKLLESIKSRSMELNKFEFGDDASKKLEEFWNQELKGGPISPDSRFILLGGNSLSAASLAYKISHSFLVEINEKKQIEDIQQR